MKETVDSLLKGAIDMHMHTAPDVFGRSVTDVEAAAQAKAAGMSGIVIKNHFTLTADRAMFASKEVGLPVYGSLVLNRYVGGFNPHAVDAALRFGAKEVWMPTLTGRHHLRQSAHAGHVDSRLSKEERGLSVLDDGGELLPEVVTILEKIATAKAILGTAHLSPDESRVLVRTAKEVGVSSILVTHPEANFVGMSIEEMKEMVGLGAMLEFDYAALTHVMPTPRTPASTAQAIKEIGADHCIMATDGGQDISPPPVEMLRRFIGAMLGQGISEAEIRTMVYTNPRRALGLA